MIIIKFESDRGELLGVLTAAEHTFATGSKGYRGQGKIKIGGVAHQIQVQLVQVHSKRKAENATEATAEPTA